MPSFPLSLMACMAVWATAHVGGVVGFTTTYPGFVGKKSSTTGNQGLWAIEVPDWSKLESPPPEGRHYGPNWSIDNNLNPVHVDQFAGAMTWAIEDSKATQFPELNSNLPVGKWLNKRRNLGICMSGGGQRAAVCALGWYRALYHLGILTKVRYIAANSGATWTTLPLSIKQLLEKKENHTDLDYKEYLGSYTEPQSIKLDKSELGKMGAILQKADVLDYQDTNKPYNDWCESIEQDYLRPYLPWKDDLWLDLSNAYLWNKPTDDIKDILNDRNTMPFPIYVATAFDSNCRDHLFPIEFTNLYSGIPMSPSAIGHPELGGGFVQGVGLNAVNTSGISTAVPVNMSSIFITNFTLPTPVVKICELTGASSNFCAAADLVTRFRLPKQVIKLVGGVYDWFTGKKVVRFLDPGKCVFWSPSSGGKPVDLALVDGGLYDNLGLHAILRRGCPTAIVCIACDGDVMTDDWSTTFPDFTSYFGNMKSKYDFLFKKFYKAKSINERCRVFDPVEMDSIVKDLKKLSKEGKPLVVRKKLKIIPNDKVGIYKDGEVDVIFCFNGRVEDWNEGLNENVSVRLGEDFPLFSTLKTHYELDEVNALAHLSSYSLVEGLRSVKF